jgi:hypothetical protein
MAEQRGLARGKEGRELKGLGDLLGDMSHFFDDTMNQSGALSFVLGGFWRCCSKRSTRESTNRESISEGRWFNFSSCI